MWRFMLDTDTVSYALRGQGRVAEHLLQRVPSELCMSSITLAELRYGAELRRSRRLHRLIDAFAQGVEPVPFEQVAAGRFGSVAATLAKAGSPIGELDTMIAAHALALQLTLVTNNARHFTRVGGLATESWL
jgi:tRNA(fMet)-specific endonuclease VapC